MKPALILIIVFIAGILSYLFIKGKHVVTDSLIARQTTIKELPYLIRELEEGKMEYGFFGITSNGIDCLYFTGQKDEMNIEFEVIQESQKSYVPTLTDFSKKHGITILKTSYGNKPFYEGLEEAPVYVLALEGSREKVSQIGTEIMLEIFGNDDNTIYDVVP
ncbi:MAG: hypothetical protein AAF388_16965 [Bacteroidota bacterium]